MTLGKLIYFCAALVVCQYVYAGCLTANIHTWGDGNPLVHAFNIALSSAFAVFVAIDFYKGASS